VRAMAFGYLVLAAVLALTLNARSRWLRVAGTMTVALSLVMIIVSIVLADFDGTFAAIPIGASEIRKMTPTILNLQALAAAGAVAFLTWMAWLQVLRRPQDPIPLRNTNALFGRVSRYFHWTIAVLMFCLVPIGLFMSILSDRSPEKAGFVESHQSLGVTVFVLAALRLLWLRLSPPPRPSPELRPAEREASAWVHIVLYGTLLGFPISGYLLSVVQGGSISVYGLPLPSLDASGEAVRAAAAIIHDWILPTLFYLAVGLHAGGVLKHQFFDRHPGLVRRMLR